MSSEFVLETQDLSISFGAVKVLKGVNFNLRRGEVVSLCGENGAGKSTLIKTLSGTYVHGQYEGRILIEGAEQRFLAITDAQAAGLSVIHQELALVPEMSVAENVFLGNEPTRFGLVDKDRMVRETADVLSRFGLAISPTARVGDLGIGQQQLVEICKALRRECRILILDEPTAALTEKEADALLATVRDLAARGVACVYISHKLDEVFAISDRITVLRDGETIVTRVAKDTKQTQIIADMVGREITNQFPRRRPPVGKPVLSVKGLNVYDAEGRHRLHDISLDVHAGEVLGIGGLMGAGRSEFLMHLFGMWGDRATGSVELLGQPLARSPRECIKQGLVFVTEDRKRFGLVLDQGVGFNMSLSSLEELSNLPGWVDRSREDEVNTGYVKQLRVKTAALSTPVRNLSGGNQQKVVIGKALMTRPKVVFLDEPTRGIDVGAKQEVFEVMNQLTAEGVAIVLVSSELNELMGMSDRIIMFAEGKPGGSHEPTFDPKKLLADATRPLEGNPN